MRETGQQGSIDFLIGELMREHSKAQSLRLSRWIGKNPKRFAHLVDLVIKGESVVSQRAAWVIGLVLEVQPTLAEPHLAALLLGAREQGIHCAVKRNIVRSLQFINLPPELHGDVMGTCFDFLNDIRETVAVQIYSMSVLAQLAGVYPEIKGEILSIIDSRYEVAAPAFRARAREVRKQLTK